MLSDVNSKINFFMNIIKLKIKKKKKKKKLRGEFLIKQRGLLSPNAPDQRLPK